MKPIILAILDGWGYSNKRGGNPILEAQKPNFDAIQSKYPMALLQASGLAVGLNWGEFGNSEVGHLSLGAGRVIEQYSTRIDHAIKNGTLNSNSVLVEALQHPTVHFIGLLTAGNVHASFEHIIALLDIAKTSGVHTFLHLFTDGKDSGLQEGLSLVKKLPQAPTTLIGRDFGMDRDNNWDLTKQAYELIAHAQGEKTEDFIFALQRCYDAGITDSKIPAFASSSYEGIQDGDALLFFNFREDSIRQLYNSFKDNSFKYSMTKYTDDDNLFLFGPPEIQNTLTGVVSMMKKRQLHIAETLKYAHVTYFFNGLRNQPCVGEEDVLVQSVKNIEKAPAMCAQEIADRIVSGMTKYDLIVANFANADMLAHTGNFEATKNGVEAVDMAIGIVLDMVLKLDGVLLITSDHGNAEKLINRVTSESEGRHDDSPVPLFLVGKEFQMTNAKNQNPEIIGILADVAPTILELMGIEKPMEMTGKSLLPELLAHDR